MRHSAYVEAVNHLTKGLEVLETLPETTERNQQELFFNTALGPALIATKGYTAPEVERVYARARELCQQVGDTPQIFPVLVGLDLFYSVRGELQTAYELEEQLLALAQEEQNEAFLMVAHCGLGLTLNYLGKFITAKEHLEQSISFYGPEMRRTHRGWVEFGVGSPAVIALTLWSLGYPDQALERSREAITLARDRSHPWSLCIALTYASLTHCLCRETHAAEELAEEIVTISTEYGFPFYLTLGNSLKGYAMAMQGEEEGISLLRQSLADSRAMGAEALRPYFLSILAETYWKVGQTKEGLATLEESLALVDKNGERFCEADLHRLKGELLLAQSDGNQIEAEACYHKALEVARSQQAKSWELRAAMSLSRLWGKQGKREEAKNLLAPVYDWFTEGFDTADLKDAKALLEEL